MSRASAQLGELARISARLENALAAGAEAGADISPALALLRSLAERAEAGGELEAADLGRAGMPDATEPQTRDAPEPAPEPAPDAPDAPAAPEPRHRRRKWTEIHKAALWAILGEGAITGANVRDGKRRRIRRGAWKDVFDKLRVPMFGPWKRYSWEDFGAVFRDAEDLASCLRAIRDEYRRTECTWND